MEKLFEEMDNLSNSLNSNNDIHKEHECKVNDNDYNELKKEYNKLIDINHYFVEENKKLKTDLKNTKTSLLQYENIIKEELIENQENFNEMESIIDKLKIENQELKSKKKNYIMNDNDLRIKLNDFNETLIKKLDSVTYEIYCNAIDTLCSFFQSKLDAISKSKTKEKKRRKKSIQSNCSY